MAQRICPRCGNPGQSVSKLTVEALVVGEKTCAGRHWLCMTPSCPVAYYSQEGNIWLKVQVRTPIAFKEGAYPKFVCYCNRVTEQDIINAVLSNKAVTLAEAIKITGAMKNGNCKINNPSGVCCSSAFKEAFDKAVNIKEG